MKIKPLYDRVILQLQPKTEQNGIYLPKDNQERPDSAIVVAVGTKEDGQSLSVGIGDQVLYNPYVCNEFQLDNTTYILIKESDILAIVEKEEL